MGAALFRYSPEAPLLGLGRRDAAPVRSASDCLDAIPPRLLAALLAGSAQPAYLVGGFVRDTLLGRLTRDIDVAVEGDPLPLVRTLARGLDGVVVPLDRERGTYRVVLRLPIDSVTHVDVNRLREPTIAADLLARDFTMNAIAVQLDREQPAWIDSTGGLRDLTERVVRAASPRTFHDDPLRLLRAVRFCVQLGFRLDEATASLIREAAPLLRRSAAERQRDEFSLILAADRSASGVRMLHGLGLLFTLLPDLEAGVGIQQPAEHYYDVFSHSVEALAALDAMLAFKQPSGGREEMLWGDLWAGVGWLPEIRTGLSAIAGENRPRSVALKFAGLLHDVSKPETKAVDQDTGRMRFYGHDSVGAGRAAASARSLRFSARETEYIELLVREHLRPGMLAAPGEVPSNRALFRFVRDLGDAAPDLLLLNLADHAAVRGPRLTRDEWRRHVAFVSWVLHMLYVETQVSRLPRLVSGYDLMTDLGLKPGPVVGRLLGMVQEAQAAGEVKTAAQALRFAREALGSLAEIPEGG
ncbi:MAG: CCA tRNA nucleotidyltransferase [Dehalococcoidia bacterium]